MSYLGRFNLYFHIVWATKNRQPLLTPQIEEAVFKCTVKILGRSDYALLALNGMPDHVHLLLNSGPQIDLSGLMKQVKGVSSALVNDILKDSGLFRWQEGYYAATVTPSHVSKITSYVQLQKEHHREGKTYSFWEETGENS